jgi:hypothetical protein
MTFQDRSKLGVECPEEVFQDGGMAWRTHGVERYSYAKSIRRSEDRLPSSSFLGQGGGRQSHFIWTAKGLFLAPLL